MIFDPVLSNCFLVLASSSSIYVLGKHSYDQYCNLQLHSISASIGIFGFCIRSTGSLIYDLFFRSYPIDPRDIEESLKREEIRQGPFRNRSVFHRIFSTVGLTGLIYAFYHSNEKKIIGSFLVFSLTMLECICAIEAWKSKQETGQENHIERRSSIRIFAEASDGFLDFYWIVIGGFYGWTKGNLFCLVAFLPYTISILTLSSEEFDKNPMTKIGFNNYMIIAHILLMTEAIRQSPSRIVQEVGN
ncbi:uncharacterized protein LOC117167881 [Belonocnema kinseyi]|uniref:uncharacterized protein LOC117167881 n=1 Tax=Belonocnema kinseyi TaxID=2817044 RepID=UPI00143DAE06|nr:uncharacterized protein LOC117167881 [Belonocnema kinseyi]